MLKKLIVLFFLSFLVFFSGSSPVFGIFSCPTTCWLEYRCAQGRGANSLCGGVFQIRTSCLICGSLVNYSPHFEETGQIWERCVGSSARANSWTRSPPSTFQGSFFNKCDGECISKHRPVEFKIYRNPTKDFKSFRSGYLSQEDKEFIRKYEQTSDILLPFYMDWTMETEGNNFNMLDAVRSYRGGSYNSVFNYITDNIIGSFRLRIGLQNSGSNDHLWPNDYYEINTSNPGSNIDNKYHSAFRQLSPCFLEILENYNVQIRTMCRDDSGWDHHNASGVQGSGVGTSGGGFLSGLFGGDEWDSSTDNYISKTKSEPEIKSIIGDDDGIAEQWEAIYNIDHWVEKRKLPSFEYFFGEIKRMTDTVTGQSIRGSKNRKTAREWGGSNVDIDWEGPGMDVRELQDGAFVNKTRMMPPILIDWCDLNNSEKERLSDKIREMNNLDSNVGDGINISYRIRFLEAHGTDTSGDINWIPHLRYIYEEFERWKPFSTLGFFAKHEWTSAELEDDPGSEYKLEEIHPTFFLDRNEFFLNYDSKYKIEIKRISILTEEKEINNRLVDVGIVVYLSEVNKDFTFVTEGISSNLEELIEVDIPREYIEGVDISVQPIPFHLYFTAIDGADFYFFELLEGVMATELMIEDTRTHPIDFYTEFKSRSDIPTPRLPHVPILVPDVVFSYIGDSANFHLKLDKEYTLKIRGCLTPEDCDDQYKKIIFKTPGAPPTNFRLISEYDYQPAAAHIPVVLSWDHMTGANSYKIIFTGLTPDFELFEKFFFVSGLDNSFELKYPYLVLGNIYQTQIFSCIDIGGKICADNPALYGGQSEYSSIVFWTISSINPPEELSIAPDIVDETGGAETVIFDWGAVKSAAYYKVKIEDEEGNIIIRIVDTNSLIIDTKALTELGRYEWRVRGCIDPDCKDGPLTAGEWSAAAPFFFVLPGEEPAGIDPGIIIQAPGIIPTTIIDWQGGLVVCGRISDNPNTAWSEREECTIKHIPLAAYTIIEYILFTIIPIIIVGLIMLTAVFYYAAFANTDNINNITPKVKNMWKGFIIGCFILFFGFVLINIFLGIIGFNIDVFGRWYEVY